MELEENLGHEIRQTPENIRRRPFVCVKERISNVSRTYSRLCWRKRQRFVIVSPWCTLVHLAVSVNMITGIKHPQPRHPRELQLTAERHALYPSYSMPSPPRAAAHPPPLLPPLQPLSPRCCRSRARHCILVIVIVSVQRKVARFRTPKIARVAVPLSGFRFKID